MTRFGKIPPEASEFVTVTYGSRLCHGRKPDEVYKS